MAVKAFLAGRTSCAGSTKVITKNQNLVQECSLSIGDCTADDRIVIGSYVQCIEQLSACTTGSEIADVEAFVRCGSSAGVLSPTCNSHFTAIGTPSVFDAGGFARDLFQNTEAFVYGSGDGGYQLDIYKITQAGTLQATGLSALSLGNASGFKVVRACEWGNQSFNAVARVVG